MSEALLHENLDLWSRTHPKEAIWLQYLEDNKPVDFHEDKKVCKTWVSTQDFENGDVICVYGIGKGYLFTLLEPWLKAKQDRQLIFLEDDPYLLRHFFETKQAHALLTNEQTHLYFFQQIEQTETIFQELYWQFAMSSVQVVAHPEYNRQKHDKFIDLHHKISYDLQVKNHLLEEYLQFGVVFYKNFYQNILKLSDSYLGNKLFGKFKNVPAIICGAGPSLDKNIDLLKDLKDKALIFAGGSALTALSSKGIKPDFGAGLDPNPEQEKRLLEVKDLTYPYIYRNRLYPKALDLVKGPKLYITGSGGYEVSSWFENRFGINERFIEEGRNVVNFCLEIAFEMGCNPIIFVGMDLAYTDMKSYCPGVIADEKVDQEALTKDHFFDGLAVEKKDIFGKPIFTLWKWVSESKWISDFSENQKETTVINATEGGLGFKGVENKTLKEVINQHLNHQQDLEKRIQTALEACHIKGLTKEKIKDALKQMHQSLTRSIEQIKILIDENKALKETVQKDSTIESLQTGKAILAETELTDEDAFLAILQIFSDVANNVMAKEIKKMQFLDDKLAQLKRFELNHKKYQYLLDAATLNSHLIEQVY